MAVGGTPVLKLWLYRMAVWGFDSMWLKSF